MYGGSAYAYANDPDFAEASGSQKYWQRVIDAFYSKYNGLRDWHTKIVQDASRDGRLVMPTGRVYNFELKRNYRGELESPDTIIKNWPVQGLGADLMSIARVSFYRRFKDAGVRGLIVNSIHDSIVCDIHSSEVERCTKLFHSVFNDLPSNFHRLFGVDFNLPMTCEVSVGSNMKELNEVE